MALPECDPSEYPREIGVEPGMPEGWKGIERLYGPKSKYAGRVYVRWSSIDGKHKHVCTPKQVITIDCQSKGIDPAPAIENYNRIMKEKVEQKKREREAKGKLVGEARETAIQRFRDRFGLLQGPLVYAFKGWTTKWHYQPNCDQVMVEYVDTEGGSWKLLKDLECALQIRIENGEEAAVKGMIEDARTRVNPAEFALGSRTARESQGVYEVSPGSGETKVLSQKERLEKRQSSQRMGRGADDSGKRRRAGRLMLDVEGPKQTAWASFDDKEGCLRAVGEYRKLLALRGFSGSTELLAVFGASAERRFHRRLRGVYVQMPEPFGGQRCYQKLLHFPESAMALGCDGIFILFNRGLRIWEFCTGLMSYRGIIAQSAECAVDGVDVHVSKASGPWLVQDGEAEFHEDEGLCILEATAAL